MGECTGRMAIGALYGGNSLQSKANYVYSIELSQKLLALWLIPIHENPSLCSYFWLLCILLGFPPPPPPW